MCCDLWYVLPKGEKIMEKFCFIDMDGVLTDFERQAFEYRNFNSELIKNKSRENMSEMEKYLQRQLFLSCDYDDKYWSTMQPMPYADVLIKKCQEKFGKNNVYILSNFVPPADAPERLNAVAGLKSEWLKNNLLQKFPENNIIITDKSKSNFVFPGKKCYLIDDMQNNIRKWEAVGGIGILHKNPVNTYMQISQIITKENFLIEQLRKTNSTSR